MSQGGINERMARCNLTCVGVQTVNVDDIVVNGDR